MGEEWLKWREESNLPKSSMQWVHTQAIQVQLCFLNLTLIAWTALMFVEWVSEQVGEWMNPAQLWREGRSWILRCWSRNLVIDSWYRCRKFLEESIINSTQHWITFLPDLFLFLPALLKLASLYNIHWKSSNVSTFLSMEINIIIGDNKKLSLMHF